MLDQILRTARTFENTHGTPPGVIYINPYHYEGLCKHYPGLFNQDRGVRFEFRLVIVPGCKFRHPEAAMLPATRHLGRVA